MQYTIVALTHHYVLHNKSLKFNYTFTLFPWSFLNSLLSDKVK